MRKRPGTHRLKLLGTLELPSPARAKFGSSVFTPASVDFDPFGQIVTAIIRPETELRNFGRFFVVVVAGHRCRYVSRCKLIFPQPPHRLRRHLHRRPHEGPQRRPRRSGIPTRRLGAGPIISPTAVRSQWNGCIHRHGRLSLVNSIARATPLSSYAVSMLGKCSYRVKQKSEIILARLFRRNGLRGKSWIIGDPAGFAIATVRRESSETKHEMAVRHIKRTPTGVVDSEFLGSLV